MAVIYHDPDSPRPFGFTHWTLYGIPPYTGVIPENGGDAFRSGLNDYGDLGYGRPQPSLGHGPRHYYFWVYALDRSVEGAPPRKEFLETYADHILGQNRVVGIYENP